MKTVGDRDTTELLVDFPPLLECRRYIMDCTFSWYSFPSNKQRHNHKNSFRRRLSNAAAFNCAASSPMCREK